MDPLEVLSFNISWACTISFVWGSSWDDSRCKSSCQSVAFPKMHLFLDDKIFPNFLKALNNALLLFQYIQIWVQKLLFFGIRVSQNAIVKIIGNFGRINAIWIFSTNNLSNSGYVDDLLRMVFINAIISTRIAYSLRDCNPLLLWCCRSWSNIFFNLHFAVCWQVPSSLQMFKSNEEREYNCVFEICWFASL